MGDTMNYDPCMYDYFVARLAESGGSLPLNLNESLMWWIVVLQRELAEANPSSKSGEIDKTPRLMVLGLDGDDELFTEVVVAEDNPENLVDGTWAPIELWASSD